MTQALQQVMVVYQQTVPPPPGIENGAPLGAGAVPAKDQEPTPTAPQGAPLGADSLPPQTAAVLSQLKGFTKWHNKELKGIPTRFPKWTEISKWEGEMIEALCKNSTEVDNLEAAWFGEIKEKTFEELADSGGDRFVWMDRQLGSFVSTHFPRDLKDRNAGKKIEMIRKKINNGIMTGRQVIRTIYDYYKRLDCTITMYGYDDLGKIVWLGDDISQMRKFLEIFDEICDHFENDEWRNNEKGREHILYKQMKKSKRMEYAVKNYWTAAEGDTRYKSLSYLRRSITSEIGTLQCWKDCLAGR